MLSGKDVLSFWSSAASDKLFGLKWKDAAKGLLDTWTVWVCWRISLCVLVGNCGDHPSGRIELVGAYRSDWF